MIHAYDEMYVEGAMIRLGDMLEYACLDCGYNPDEFWKMFLISGLARRMELGDVSIVAGKSGPEIAYVIMSEVDKCEIFLEPTWREDRSDLYWCGWVLAYFQWYRNVSFKQIWEQVSIRMLQKMYVTLHEADIMKAVDVLTELIEPARKNTVRNLRLVKGLTQQELADEAHMTLSQLQRIEYGERKVENMTLKTALALAKALGVEVEELG